jgi:hypothetical protein
MPDYKETQVAGSSYRRGYKMTFFNNFNAAPRVLIDEEDVFVLDANNEAQVIRQPAGNISRIVDDFTKTLYLRNPVDGSKLEATISYGELYQSLYSLYWHLAEERDIVPLDE